jgi:hypothetical protein
VDKFKVLLEKKVNCIIKEEKVLASTPRSDRGGGKSIVTIFSRRMSAFKVLQTSKTIFQGCIDSQICLFQLFKQNHL